MAARIPMIAITTNSSINVKALCLGILLTTATTYRNQQSVARERPGTYNQAPSPPVLTQHQTLRPYLHHFLSRLNGFRFLTTRRPAISPSAPAHPSTTNW